MTARHIAAGCTLFLAIVLTALSTMASAQSYPSKPIRIILPYLGSTEFVGRWIATKLSAAFGQQVIVENRPGVLARVASLFARRGFNIFSLAVAPTEDPDLSRITVVVDVEDTPLEQIVKQLFKLIDVVRITELDPRKSVERELIVATVRADGDSRGRVAELANIFEAKVLAVGADAVTISLDGTPEKVDDFEELLKGFGIVESQRTGRVALPKLDREARPRAHKGKAS